MRTVINFCLFVYSLVAFYRKIRIACLNLFKLSYYETEEEIILWCLKACALNFFLHTDDIKQ